MAATVIAFIVIITYYLARRPGNMPWGQLSTIGLLQTMMFAVVLLVLWQPALVSERLLRENAVAIMLDTSGSMTFSDGTESRMVQAQQLLTPDSLEDIAEIYSILPYGFDGSATPWTPLAPCPSRGNHESGPVHPADPAACQRLLLGAVILISDGADNNNAIAQAELNEMASFGVPIHTVGMGREDIPEDLELTGGVLAGKSAPGTTLSARVAIRHDQGGFARIKVYDGDTFLTPRKSSSATTRI